MSNLTETASQFKLTESSPIRITGRELAAQSKPQPNNTKTVNRAKPNQKLVPKTMGI